MKQNTASDRIAGEIEQRIRRGQLRAGDRVPSAREIVRDWGVALATASKVQAILRRRGLVKARPGVGTVVRAGGERGPELGADQIVRAAIAIADEEGVEGLAMRQVAIELGVPTVALARHFDGVDALVIAMADTVLGDAPLPRANELGWRETLEAVLRAQWRGYAQHPWLVRTVSMTRPQIMPRGMQHTERVLEAVETLGLGPVETLRTAVMLLAYVRGMAVGLDAEREAEQDTGMTSDEWIHSRESLFTPLTKRFPTLGRLASQTNVDMGLDALFERGLAVLLDGLAASTSARSRRPRAARPRARPLGASPR
jgi:DNA-binding transcriptional regulator YhcF (GntR family)